jgi:diketogulonate reductase-like aldo/keto reductase
LPALGGLLESPTDPTYTMSDGRVIPTLAFGLYKVPPTEEGKKIIADAIAAGYRHFDTASVYANERILGQAIRNSGIPRENFILCSKVWNDAQKEGKEAVRRSVENSLAELGCGYIDIMYVHWPVPGRFVDTYKELQEHWKDGKIRNIGISNFGVPEYEELMNCQDITVPPTVNQIEVSPFMYRPSTIQYFQDRGILIAASKALHRATGIDQGVVPSIANAHDVTPAKVLLRWSFQKRLIVVAKTARTERMKENRDILQFSLTEKEMKQLDSLTSEETVLQREALELQRREGV